MLFAHGDVASVLLCAPNGLSLSKHRDVGAMANGEVRLLPERALADYSDFDARDTVYALDPFHQPRVTRTRRYTLNEHIVAPMADARTTAAKLSAHFRTALADELRSFVVFGSLPRGEFIPGVSDLNILVLLESLTTPKLFGPRHSFNNGSGREIHRRVCTPGPSGPECRTLSRSRLRT